MTTFARCRQLFMFLVACVAFVACAAVHAETAGNRMQQSKQIGELGETLQRSGASLQRLIAIVQGMNSAATTAEQINRSTFASAAYDVLGTVDCQLAQVWGMLVMYDAMTHEPDRRRVAPKLLQIQDRTSNDAQRLLDRVETTWLPKLSGSPAGDAITESLREFKKATEMLRAIKL